VDVVKIDRGFVTDADVNADDAAIVESIVSMAHTLGRDLVAEGVERTAQADLLRRLRVQRAQGFLFHRPMPAREATALLLGLLPAPHAGSPVPTADRNGTAQGERRRRASPRRRAGQVAAELAATRPR
jgi:predicted signal transduction protein with EAL and GGDEF domain